MIGGQSRIAPGNSELYRLLLRSSGFAEKRPGAPRELSYANGCIRWKAPEDPTIVTHYIVRIDNDGGGPSVVVPVGTSWIPVPPGQRAYVSSWNMINRQESARIPVDISARQGGTDSLKVELPAGAGETDVEYTDGVPDSILIVEIVQNATGNRTIAWGDNFDADTPTNISMVADAVTRFAFWWDTDKWKIIAMWPVFEYPGDVTVNLASVDIDESTDLMKSIITAEADLPDPLNGFDGCEAFFRPDAAPHLAEPLGHIPHPIGGAGPFKVHIEVMRPVAAVSGKIYLVSRNGKVSNALITSGAAESPNFPVELTARADVNAATAPTSCAISVVLDGETYSLSTSWVPAVPVGGTTKWGRQVRYFSDAACTTPVTGWIPLVDVYGEAVTSSATDFQPRPNDDQWVKLRVRGLNWQDAPSAWTESASGAKVDRTTGGVIYDPPNTPVAVSVSIIGREETFGLQVVITPPSPLGGTAGYDREARYFNDAGLTVPDSDWIPIGWVDDASTTSTTPFWPRPQQNQWVIVRVRGTNWNGDVTPWVTSATPAALTPIAIPPTILGNSTTVRYKDDNGVPKFGFRITITPNGSLSTTEFYEVQARFFNDAGLVSPDSNWIPLGGVSPSQLTFDTDFWDCPASTQWARTRIAAVNGNGELSAWVESVTLVINPSTGLDASNLDPASLEVGQFSIVSGKLRIASISAGLITAGTINASVTMTAPSLQITGSGFTVLVDSTNGIRVSNTTNNAIITTSTGNLVVSNAANSLLTSVKPGGIAINGNLGGVSLDAGPFNIHVRVLDTLGAGFTITPSLISNSLSGAAINMNSTGQYILANQYRWSDASLGTEAIDLSTITTSRVAYAYDKLGNYLGKIPIFL